ncbi:MAG: hypothetical protein JSV92_02385 [archaeon]|nr:MAG: hypothetical protein JSV92_02385 [archaeon]
MLFKKKNFGEIGDVDLEKLEPISDFEHTGKISSLGEDELTKDSKRKYELILKLKKKERIYSISIMALIIMNLFLTGIVIYLGIVKIA